MKHGASIPSGIHGWVAFIAAISFAILSVSAGLAQAPKRAPSQVSPKAPVQSAPAPAVPAPAAGPADPVAIPSFWDPRRRPERPDLSRVSLIRFLTEVDYPPFNYLSADGNPAGLNVDLALMV